MTRCVTIVTAIEVQPALWRRGMLQEGILECWLRTNGAKVEAGEPVAAVRIENARHELAAPARGRLHAELGADSTIEPGTVT